MSRCKNLWWVKSLTTNALKKQYFAPKIAEGTRQEAKVKTLSSAFKNVLTALSVPITKTFLLSSL
jgi:hypothetical protein